MLELTPTDENNSNSKSMEYSYNDIERYLRNQLDEPERRAFENKMDNNPAFARRVEEVKRGLIAAKLYAEKQLSGELYQRGKAILEAKKAGKRWRDPERKKYFRRRLIAGSLLVVIVVLLVLYLSGVFSSPEKEPPPAPESAEPSMPSGPVALADYFFELKETSGLLSFSPDDPVEQRWSNVVRNYQSGDCQAVVDSVAALLRLNNFDNRSTAYLLSGTCYLQLDQPEQAIQQLGQIPPETGELYRDAQWYAGLAYLKQSNLTEAQEIFRSIAENEEHLKQEEAQQILRQLAE